MNIKNFELLCSFVLSASGAPLEPAAISCHLTIEEHIYHS